MEAFECNWIKNRHKTLFWPGFSYFLKLWKAQIRCFSQNYEQNPVSKAENWLQKWSFGIGRNVSKSQRSQLIGTVMHPLPIETNDCAVMEIFCTQGKTILKNDFSYKSNFPRFSPTCFARTQTRKFDLSKKSRLSKLF